MRLLFLILQYTIAFIYIHLIYCVSSNGFLLYEGIDMLNMPRGAAPNNGLVVLVVISHIPHVLLYYCFPLFNGKVKVRMLRMLT